MADQLSDVEKQLSDVEKALYTLATEFHRASGNNSATLTWDEFVILANTKLPTMATADGGVDRLRQQMELDVDQRVPFEKFWKLVEHEATQQYNRSVQESAAKNNTAASRCLLQ